MKGGLGGDPEEAVIAAAAALASKKAWDVSVLLNDDQREAVSKLGELLQHRPYARREWDEEPPPGEDEGGDGEASDPLPEALSIAALYRLLGDAQEGAEDMDDEDLAEVHDHHQRMVGIVQLCDKIIELLTIVDKTLVGLQVSARSRVLCPCAPLRGMLPRSFRTLG
jgi:hypothetical protein